MIELEVLEGKYTREVIAEIVRSWQEDEYMHPLTCVESEHGKLIYQDGILVCPNKDCFYHQHWIPEAVVHLYEDERGITR